MKERQNLTSRCEAPLLTPTDLKSAAAKDIAEVMNAILADAFALYLKTKNFHWHMSGPHFSRLSPAAGRAGGSDLRHDGPDRRARAEARRPYDPVD